ncbi:hypothetical protein [Zestomonas carbonaria]|uniref:Uncharacterized protein n=1 Tax=Zestomonas carbonaria TaxID=2762745 RepID=A0A7U7ENL6_9GAMM|nr:hypothetical protein [Pseudomonas carbonaria]CAD5108308.1 hypothetical protein PSEWESI4_02593 [Pseudomonas carbonaria]
MSRWQQGVTLISMMVGLLISLLVILVMMTSFRTLISISAEASRGAFQDGELATALTALQMDIQGAGYGLDATVSPALVKSPISLPEHGSEEALLWRFKDGGALTCAGVVERADTDPDSSQPMRVVSRLLANDCSETAGLASFEWVLGEDLLRFKNQTARQLRITLDEEACSPFGALGESENHPIVILSAPSSTQHAGASAAPVSYSICLLNIPVSDS